MASGPPETMPTVPSLDDIQENLRGAPGKLLGICLIQILLLLLGVFVGTERRVCQVNPSTSGASITINCSTCVYNGDVSAKQIILLIAGFLVIMIGVLAAILRKKSFCRAYGLLMMIFAFVVGLTSLLTGLEAPLLEAAIERIDDPVCASAMREMVDNTRVHSILYAINCFLDCAGALFAIKSKETFEFQEIQDHHTKYTRSIDL